jgi:hypothetical protein
VIEQLRNRDRAQSRRQLRQVLPDPVAEAELVGLDELRRSNACEHLPIDARLKAVSRVTRRLRERFAKP